MTVAVFAVECCFRPSEAFGGSLILDQRESNKWLYMKNKQTKTTNPTQKWEVQMLEIDSIIIEDNLSAVLSSFLVSFLKIGVF